MTHLCYVGNVVLDFSREGYEKLGLNRQAGDGGENETTLLDPCAPLAPRWATQIENMQRLV